jgi:hypothetical protein
VLLKSEEGVQRDLEGAAMGRGVMEGLLRTVQGLPSNWPEVIGSE